MIKTDDAIIFPSNSMPLGVSYPEWCERWCRWVLSMSKGSNPTTDESGILTQQNQNIPGVFFLCQTFESTDHVPHRMINLPVGSCLFMPVINWISVLGGNEENEQDLKTLAKKMMDEVVTLHLSINSKHVPIDLRDYRVQSPVLRMVLPKNNILNVEGGETSVLVEGFWIFVLPLAREILIETFGACRSGKTQIAVNYLVKTCSR